MRPDAVLFAVLVVAPAAKTQDSDEARGAVLFQRRCGGCHSPDRSKEGPKLRGVIGRVSASVPDFEYSGALKNAKITWTDETVDKWLTDTDSVVPGNNMTFRVPNSSERQSLIAYLKTLR